MHWTRLIEKLGKNTWVRFLAYCNLYTFVLLQNFLIYRGCNFMVIHPHHLGFQCKLHPPPSELSPSSFTQTWMHMRHQSSRIFNFVHYTSFTLKYKYCNCYELEPLTIGETNDALSLLPWALSYTKTILVLSICIHK